MVNEADREFLEWVDNQLSGLIRHASYLRQRIMDRLEWADTEAVEATDETPNWHKAGEA